MSTFLVLQGPLLLQHHHLKAWKARQKLRETHMQQAIVQELAGLCTAQNYLKELPRAAVLS
jgi:hypothetical protein